jgi:hypothetical protein
MEGERRLKAKNCTIEPIEVRWGQPQTDDRAGGVLIYETRDQIPRGMGTSERHFRSRCTVRVALPHSIHSAMIVGDD